MEKITKIIKKSLPAVVSIIAIKSLREVEKELCSKILDSHEVIEKVHIAQFIKYRAKDVAYITIYFNDNTKYNLTIDF